MSYTGTSLSVGWDSGRGRGGYGSSSPRRTSPAPTHSERRGLRWGSVHRRRTKIPRSSTFMSHTELLKRIHCFGPQGNGFVPILPLSSGTRLCGGTIGHPRTRLDRSLLDARGPFSSVSKQVVDEDDRIPTLVELILTRKKSPLDSLLTPYSFYYPLSQVLGTQTRRVRPGVFPQDRNPYLPRDPFDPTLSPAEPGG